MKFELVEINDIHYEDYNGIVYDLTVEEDHSYNINGIVVHNSLCSTRVQTGVGVPQLSAVIECADSAHGLGGSIISDGGCTCPGDISKAFSAGADMVMLGGMFAGHDECSGEIIEKHFESNELRWSAGDWKKKVVTKKYKLSYGMSSETAMKKYYSDSSDYRSSEGRTIEVEYRGSVENTIKEMLGGIRSAMTYIGAKRIKDMPKCATFVKVHNQYNTSLIGVQK